MKLFKRARKLFAVLTSILMLVQPILPVFPSLPHPVYAQEATASSEQPSPAPTDELTPAPTEEVTPTVEPTSTPIESEPTETPVPTETVEPTPQPEADPPLAETTEPPKETGPPQEQGQILDGVSVTLTPSITVEEPVEEGELQAVIFQNVEAESLNLDNVDPSNSATLTTDKADYAPTDTAVITGTGFTPRETYSLTISSNDQPPTSTTAGVTADENGSFVYAYQLDGTYRPNYKVEAKNNSVVIAETTFTDAPVSGTIVDAAGANDEPGQKDLNQLFFNYTNTPTSIDIAWNWDDTGWTGSNTGDACGLFDTDNDGYANYSLCVSVNNTPAVYLSKALFSCNDTRADRCPGSVAISPVSSSCVAGVQATDPFPTGDYNPNDTVASCTVQLSEVGGSSSKLLDVCSFPSQQPNSDPSDCIVASTASQTGFLEVKKVLSPTSDTGLFNLQIDGTTYAYDATHNGSTGEKVVDTGNHTVGETAGTGISLGNYTSGIVCKNGNGTGSTIASSSNSGPLTVSIANNADVVCTITNTRINNASLTVVKNAIPDSAQDFAFTTTGTGLSNFSLDDDTDVTLSNTRTFTSLGAGTYAVSESVVAGWSQTSAVCSDGSPVSAVNLSAGESVTCTFTNTKLGKIITEKQTNPADSPQAFTFTPSWGSSFQLTDNQTYDSGYLPPGNYSVTETVPTDWRTPSISCTNGDTDASFNLQAGEVVTCTFTNTQNGSISGFKFEDTNGDGIYQAGTESIISWSFFIDANGNGTYDAGVDTYTSTTGIPATYQFTGLTPGLTYRICEVSNSNYFPTNPISGCTDVVAQAGVDVTQNFGNARKGTIVVKKVMVGGTDTFTFTGDVSGTITTDGGTLQTANVLPGSYTATESAQIGWDLTSIVCDDTNSTGNTGNQTATFIVDPSETITCTFTNTKRGHIIVDKVTVPGGSNQSFDFTGGGAGYTNFSLTDADSPNNKEVVPGAYSVSENIVAGWDSDGGICDQGETPASLDVGPGETVTCTFTNTQRGSISGVKYDDADGSDSTTDDRTVLAGWVMELWKWVTDAFANTGLTDTTDINGVYSFENVIPGLYQVREQMKVGWTNVTPTSLSVTLVAGESDTGNNFVNTAYGTIVVVKQTVPDASQQSFDFDLSFGDGDADLSDGQQDSTGNLVPGTYSVTENTPSGWDLTRSTCSDGSTPTSINLQSGETVTCTFTNTQRGAISGSKTHDVDADGNVLELEPMLNGWTIFIDENDDGILDPGEISTVTQDINLNPGEYIFENLIPGTYSVCEVEQNGWKRTIPSSSKCQDVIVSAGQTTYDVRFGNVQLATIIVEKQTTPNGATGTFTFTGTASGSISDNDQIIVNNVLPGQYTSTESDPTSGFDLTNISCDDTTNRGTASTGDLNSRTATFNVEAGETVTCTFTNTQRGSIAGRKYNDTNGNGARGGSEPYLDGWTIHIFDTEWTEVSQMQTGDDTTTAGPVDQGQYKFTNLTPATYYVCEDLQAGWSQSQPSSGETRNNSYCRTITVNPGESITGQHFGNIELGVIQSRKYDDTNGDSAYTTGESYLDGWTIRLYKDSNGWQPVDSKITGHTGTLGQYRFEDLAFDTYYICEVLQDGWAQTDPSSSEGYANLSGASDEAGRCRRFIVDSSGDESIGEKHFGNQGQGTIIVEKDVVPDSGATFEFSIQGDYIETIGFTLGDGGSTNPNYTGLPAGTYSVSETPNDLYSSEVQCVSSDDDTEVVSALNLDPGETITCTFTNTRKTGDLLVHKMVRSDVEGEFVSADPGDFTWGTSEGNTPYAMGSSQTFDTGEYNVYENTVTNYHPVGWYFTDDEGSCEEPEYTELPASVTVNDDQTTEITLCNARDTGTITVNKETVPSGSQELFTINLNQGLAGDPTLINSSVLADQDAPDTYSVITGEYWFTELEKTGWDLTNAECSVGRSTFDPRADSFVVNADDNITCTFTNTQRGTIIVTKYNDEDGDGKQDEGEDVLSGWTMKLTGDFEENTGVDGVATFENMLPGEYTLTEELQPGWEQTELLCREPILIRLADDTIGDSVADTADDTTGGNGQFTLDPGETQRCVVGNHRLNPILTISKSHAASDDVKNPSENVLFTITVAATQSAAFNVFVTDLPANGFTYRTNSWTANSTARGDLKALGITTQPTYASPGVWTLGDMEKDETVTLTYIADISSEQKPGIYKDLAWGYGCRFEIDCEVGDANSVLSNAVSPGVVDDNFVGTQVEISKDLQSGATLNKTEGEVLGAATELPATGADELWIKLAALMFIVGLGFIAAGKYTRRLYV